MPELLIAVGRPIEFVEYPLEMPDFGAVVIKPAAYGSAIAGAAPRGALVPR